MAASSQAATPCYIWTQAENVVFSDQDKILCCRRAGWPAVVGRQDSLGHQLPLSLRGAPRACLLRRQLPLVRCRPRRSPPCARNAVMSRPLHLPTSLTHHTCQSRIVCMVRVTSPPPLYSLGSQTIEWLPQRCRYLLPSPPLVRMQANPTRDSPTASARGIPPHRPHFLRNNPPVRSCLTTFPTAAPSHHDNFPSHRHPNAVMPTATATAATTTPNDDRDDDELATTLP